MLSKNDVVALRLNLDDIFAGFDRYSKIGLAVSGGADSLALLMLAEHWTRGRRSRLVVFSVDHGLRPESAGEVEQVGEIAKRCNLDFVPLKWTGEKPAKGVQAKARAARYQLIGQAMKERGAEILLTGHHSGDQAETILMRLAHKSGLGGLAGMPKMTRLFDVVVGRPLLGFSKERLELIVKRAGLRPVIDPSNFDEKFERPRWRSIMPELRMRNLDEESLRLFGQRMRRADQALATLTEAADRKLRRIDPFGIGAIKRAGFDDLPEELRLRVLFRAIADCGGETDQPDLNQIEDLTLRLAQDVFRGTSLGGCWVERTQSEISLVRECGRGLPRAQSLEAGQATIWDGRFRFENRSASKRMKIAPLDGMKRSELEAFVGAPVRHNMARLRSAPAVRDDAGTLLGVGTLSHDPSLFVEPTVNWTYSQE
ncbi:MAG: tRNA lysidine(34) synthetase TilS [Hyphomicrobiaceae bacterium]|nr:tRNA lysidine(34) synthetase TilS [Hyphomicrobiaceae bacterium]